MSPNYRLLVIDDDRDVADSLAMLMESFDAEVRIAYDGASGVQAVADFRPDIVFIDIRMPEIDGYETARRIRAEVGDRAPMLVALTGLSANDDPGKSVDAGFDFELAKPVSAAALEKALRSASSARAETGSARGASIYPLTAPKVRPRARKRWTKK